MVSWASWVCYSGVCSRGDHDDRQVSVVIDDDTNHNQHEHVMIRCGECGHIVKAEPDSDLLSEYGVEM